MPPTPKASFRIPDPIAARLNKKNLNNTAGYLRYIELGLEFDDILGELGNEFDAFRGTVGLSREVIIKECIQAVMDLADAKKPITPFIFDAFALGLKRAALRVQREQIALMKKSETALASGDRDKAKRFKEEAVAEEETFLHLEKTAEEAKRPFVRVTPGANRPR